MREIQGAARPDRLSVDTRAVDGVRVVVLRGEIDHTVRDRFRQALLPPPGTAGPRTVADFGGVTFMDSSGINVLIAAHHAARDAGGWLRVAGAQESVLRVMRLVGVDTLVPCYPDAGEAVDGSGEAPGG
ncbi:STAS domain-containing protein [Streptomyces sp. NPDC006610]|uniref:STAS domain-containing protein n=1 Tax=Streptomyces sp. NPDC006610 TaxID=3154584 RepID=UPI0033AA2F0C